MRQLAREEQGDWVFDPFCGRGTTAFAAMMHGLNVVSVDINPVATAITRAKSSTAKPHEIVNFARVLINEQEVVDLPTGEYWRHAYKPKVLRQICSIREGLFGQTDDTSNALRGVMLGCLHGPIQGSPSYFSNQMQRTFSPKPNYAVTYWKRNALRPPDIDVIEIIRKKANRAFGDDLWFRSKSIVYESDIRTFNDPGVRFSHIVTSPPYLGMKSYGPDQWLREWFIGGPPYPDYNQRGQIGFSGYDNIVNSLATVWSKAAEWSRPGARLSIRFGVFGKMEVNCRQLIKDSINLSDSGWRHIFTRDAGLPPRANSRQATQMGKVAKSQAKSDYDFRFMLA